MLIRRERSGLLIVDVQERLATVMADPRRVIHHCGLLLRFARRLGVPVLASEQYPQGLGPTMIDLRAWLEPDDIVAKTCFSCVDDPAWSARWTGLGCGQAVVAGVEAHVCVLQTALDLKARGIDVFVVTDASGSRHEGNEAAAWRRLGAAGIALVTVEMVLFEWLRAAGTAEFKDLAPFVR